MKAQHGCTCENAAKPISLAGSTMNLVVKIPSHPNAPALQHVEPTYIDGSENDIGIPNIVTSVLASYRGYDTLGEVAVIFTAGIGVMFLLGLRREDEDDDGTVRKSARTDPKRNKGEDDA